MTETTAPLVSIVVVSYNTRELTLKCLRSITEQTTLSHEIIVVDNASGDGTPDAVRQERPDATLVESGGNVGFARAVNAGARLAHGRWLLLLNPDTTVLDHAVDRLVAFAEKHPEHGVYGGRTLDGDGHLDPMSCWGAPSLTSLLCFATGLSTAFPRSVFDPESLGQWRRDDVREVDIVTGCLLLSQTAVFRQLGGLDEVYFMYAEDADYCFRARRAGYRPIIYPAAEIVHESGASTASHGKRMSMVMRGRATYVRRLWRSPRRELGLALLLSGVLLRAVLSFSARTVRPGRASGSAWRQVWRERRVWLQGW